MSRTPSPENTRNIRIKRMLIFGALCLILATAQCSFFAELHICPATPDLLLGLLLGALLLDSPYTATAVAIGAGLLSDALGASGFFLSPLYYLAVVLLLSPLASKMLSAFPSYLLLIFPALVLRALYTLLCIVLVPGPLPTIDRLGITLLWEAVTTLIVILPLYPIVKLCMRPLRARSRFHF
jgi:hypothetical protein